MSDLFPYQETGAAWLTTKRHALLADEMGLGKSAQVIRALDLIDAQNVLVVGPAVLRRNWIAQLELFSKRAWNVTNIETGTTDPKPGFNVISYDLLTNESLRKKLNAMSWDVLCLDEAHYLKERTAKRTKFVYGAGKTRPGLMDKAGFVWRLTGTPIMNYADELWTHLKSMGVVQESYWDFTFRYCKGFDSTYGYKITGHKNTEELKSMLRPVMLRRKKEDVLQQLPPIYFQNIVVDRSPVDLDPWFLENIHNANGQDTFLSNIKNMDSSLKTALASVLNHSHARFDDSLNVLDGFKAASSTMRRYIGHAKLPKALDIIEEELATGKLKKVVIFAMHQQIIELTRQRLRKFKPVTLYGATPTLKRHMNIESFQNDPKTKVFIGQIVAAGAGITLTAANEVVFLESDWVPANNAQASMRCHRIGQEKAVRVRFFTCANSVDEQIANVLIQKTREITKIVD